jgi:hypothetical protein
VLSLVKWGYDFEDTIVKKPIHIVLERFDWFKKDADKEMKRQQSITCPLNSLGKSKKTKKK